MPLPLRGNEPKRPGDRKGKLRDEDQQQYHESDPRIKKGHISLTHLLKAHLAHSHCGKKRHPQRRSNEPDVEHHEHDNRKVNRIKTHLRHDRRQDRGYDDATGGNFQPGAQKEQKDHHQKQQDRGIAAQRKQKIGNCLRYLLSRDDPTQYVGKPDDEKEHGRSAHGVDD